MIDSPFEQFEISKEMMNSSHKKFLQKGEKLYEKGDIPSGIFYLSSGVIGLIDLSVSGNESLLRIFSKDNFVGHRSFLAHENYHATASVLSDSEVLFFPCDSIEKLISLYPDLLLFLTKQLARDLRRSEERLNDFTGKKVFLRIAQTLLYLKSKDGNYLWTRKEIGGFCGAKTETVTRALSFLESEKIIKKEGRKLIIPSIENFLDYIRKEELLS